ncbi:DUF4397 domain-containing protein [Halobacillus sp. BAB-2008]|uniref:DUF4397 domain-containing protein n=1 Tax=Halobacillus sp. BAB-2008 TaxID=1246484 RepID=UPI0002A4D746|nr:DUF4397 domain-containing protein [Halobacillus sp. BAB-2008]ELK48826.1 hypothetical protein D479_00975 [Halobacillus sp. BAB-2008]
MKKFITLFTAVALVLSLFAPSVFADGHESNAMVRILHASPDAPAVDVYVNDEAVVEGAEFKAATDYMEVPAGEHKVEIYAAGTKGEQDPVISTTVTVESGMAYTAAAINNLDSLELKALQDSMDSSEGMAKIRVGHFIPGAPAVDVGPIDGDALFAGAEFPMVTDYKELEPGTYDLEVRTTDGTQLIDLSGTTLESGKVYSAFAVGTADNPEVLLLQDSNAMPSEMPATGLGGTAASSSSTIWYAAILGVLAMGAGLLFTRKRFNT